MARSRHRVTWTDDPLADLRSALDSLDEENRKAIKQHGAPPPWPLTPGTPRHVIDAARRLVASTGTDDDWADSNWSPAEVAEIHAATNQPGEPT